MIGGRRFWENDLKKKIEMDEKKEEEKNISEIFRKCEKICIHWSSLKVCKPLKPKSLELILTFTMILTGKDLGQFQVPIST